MEIIKELYTLNELSIAQAKYFKDDSLLFDIECLGLTPKKYPIYLICCAYRVGNEVTLVQFFANKSSEEEELLIAFNELVSRYTNLISFNGTRFDTPFIIERMSKYNMEFTGKSYPHLDLYLTLLKGKCILNLPRYKQKTFEEFFGLFREDEYDGGKLIAVYNDYQRTQSDELRHLLLLHNFEDVKGMITVINALTYIEYLDCSIIASTITKNETAVSIIANTDITLPIMVSKETKYGLFIFKENTISGSLELLKGHLNTYLKDYRNYIYIEAEDIIIPKQIASNDIKKHNKAATKENCKIKKEGTFVRIPANLVLPDNIHVFKPCYDSKVAYIQLSDLTEDTISLILKFIIKH